MIGTTVWHQDVFQEGCVWGWGVTLELSFQGGGKEERMNGPGRKSSTGRGIAHLENDIDYYTQNEGCVE